MIDMRNKDAEDLQYMTSPAFWQMINETRQMPTVPLAEVRAELLTDDPSEKAE